MDLISDPQPDWFFGSNIAKKEKNNNECRSLRTSKK